MEQEFFVLFSYFIIGILAGYSFAMIHAQNKDNDNNSNNKKASGPVVKDAKMVLGVRMDSKLNTEEVCVLSAQATLQAYNSAINKDPNSVKYWERFGQTKIAVKVPSEEVLLELAEQCEKNDLPFFLDPNHRILGIGPASASVINTITGSLKLL